MSLQNLQNAQECANLGIPITQIPAGQKGANTPNWEDTATNNVEEIARRFKTSPELSNYGLVARAENGGFLFFDDDGGGRKAFETTGGKMQPTRKHESCSGGFHYIYRHSAKSLEFQKGIGKAYISVPNPSGGELWSLRMHNAYVVGPGSIAKNHNGELAEYKIAYPGEIIPIPDDLFDFLVKSYEAETSQSEDCDSETWMDEPIPDGKRNSTLTAVAGNMRRIGLDEESIFAAISVKNQNQCNPPLHDDEVHTIARSVSRYTPEETTLLLGGVAINGVDAIKIQADKIQQAMDEAERWRLNFKTVKELEDGEVRMLISGFLPEGTTFIGGLPGEGKTLFALSIAKALTTGQPFLRRFMVPSLVPVLYLIPESGGRAFRKRCERFGIPNDPNLFLCRTVSEGVTLDLSDASVLAAVRRMKPVVILDTLIRFSESDDENDAMQNKKLVDDVIALRQAGAVGVIGIHHATKIMRTQGMTLETALRGTGDIAASADAVYGLLRDSTLYANGSGPNQIDVACLKPRDFDPPTPFRIAASQKTDSGGLSGLTPDIVSVIDAAQDFLLVREGSVQAGLDEKLVQLVTECPDINVRELEQATRVGAWVCRKALNRLGWSRKRGGSGGASAWIKRPN